MATATQRSNGISEMVELAKSLGVPADSLCRFLSFGYVPQPRQLAFHAAARECDNATGPQSIGFGGARGPGKTHATFAQIALDDCQRVPGLKVLFLRKVSKSVREAVSDLRRKVLRFCPHTYKEQQAIIEFPNESRILLGHFNHEKDIDAYLGLEYDLIAIEEATQLTETKRRDILTCLRTSRTDWRPRDYNTTNPGGVGHGWFKKEFIEPFRKLRESKTRFIPATVHDNKFVDADYRGRLETLTGWKRRAWLDGEWDIAAGQFFSTWNYEAHTYAYTAPPAPIPANQPVWLGFDYGFNHPTACHLLTEHDGIVDIVDEYVERKALPRTNADGICAMLERHGVTVERLESIEAGADCFARRGDQTEGKTIAEQYAEFGLEFSRATIERINGAAEILQLLGDVERDLRPRLRVSRRCVRLIELMPSLQHDPHRPEDVLKVDANEEGEGGDDPYDSFRYGVMRKNRKWELW